MRQIGKMKYLGFIGSTTKRIAIIGLLFGFIIINSCEKSKDSDKGNVSFGINTHVINCIATAEVFVDSKSIGFIPGTCDTIVNCNSPYTLNKEISVGKHSYRIDVIGQSGSCLRIKEGDFDLVKDDCLRIFGDLRLRDEK